VSQQRIQPFNSVQTYSPTAKTEQKQTFQMPDSSKKRAFLNFAATTAAISQQSP